MLGGTAMSEKKSPPRKASSGTIGTSTSGHANMVVYENQERSAVPKTSQSAKVETKTLKRKLFSSSVGNSEDESTEKLKTTPKRRRSLLAGEGSPNPGSTTPKTPGSVQRLVPLSERQQMALLMQLTAEETAQGGDTSPRPNSPHTPSSAVKKTPLEKKVNKRNERGETPLHLAAIKGDSKQTRKLIKAGADVNIKDFAGWTPLHEACNHGWLDVARTLLKSGANVNVQGLDNDTPLHDAAINGHPKLVELLVRHGANPLQTNSKGKSPLDVAANPDIVKLLKNEIIASSSSGSSPDEARSPTSPESLLSDREDDHKSDSQGVDDLYCGLLSSPGSLAQTASLLKARMPGHLSHSSLDKMTSPHLRMRFHHIKTKESPTGESPQRSKARDSHYKSYSVTVETDYEQSGMPGSPAPSSSSQDSDLYNPHLGVTSFSSVKLDGSENLPDSTNVNNSEVGSTSQLMFGDIFKDSVERKSDLCSSSRDSGSTIVSVNKSAADSQLPSSQDSGRFTPHFEDISDDEVGGEGETPMDVDSTTPPSTHPSACLASHIPQTGPRRLYSSKSDPAVSESSSSSSSTCRPFISGYPRDSSSTSHVQLQSLSSSSFSVPPPSETPLGKFIRNRERDRDRDRDLEKEKERERQRERESQLAASIYRFEDSLSDKETKSPKSDKDSNKSPKSDKDFRLSPKVDRDSRSPKNDRDRDRSSPKFERDPKLFHMRGEKERPLVRFDRENRTSPKHSPKPEREGKTSPKNDKELRHSPKMEKDMGNNGKPSFKLDSNRSSPKPDRMSPKCDKDCGRPASPKVPPLKIIIPPKAAPSQPGDGDSLKALLMKPALPYVLNPTQEGAGANAGVGEGLKGVLPDNPLATPAETPIPDPQPTPNPIPDSQTGTAKSEPADTEKTAGEKDSSNKSSRSSSPSDQQQQQQQPQQQQQQQQQQQTQQQSSSSSSSSQSSSSDGSVSRRGRGTKERDRDSNSDKGDTSSEKGDIGDRDDSDSRDKDNNGSVSSGQKEEQRRMTRSVFRSQRQQQQQGGSNGGDSDKEKDKEVVNNTRNHQREEDDEVNMHPRKRKLRPRTEPQLPEKQQPPPPPPQPAVPQPMEQQPAPLPIQHHEKPENPYELFLDIRRQIAFKQSHWEIVQPKPPQGFKDYLMVSCNYVLQGKTTSRLALPMLSPPNSVTGPMRDLFIEQERARYKLRLQHVIEREKLMLSMEQEIMREHGRAARAMANQGTPLSFCTILRDEEVYNPMAPEQDEKEKNVRSRYNGRQLLSWLQDVDDKFEKIKEALLLRHHHEVESLHAVQKLEWEWKMKDMGACDWKTTPVIDDLSVPMVQVNDDFELLPT